MKNSYGSSKNEQIIAAVGRKLMDISEKMPMKGLRDDEVARSNRMSTFGDALTRFGTVFGPKTLEDVLRVSNVSKKEAEEFMQLGYTQ
jgi:hypothetical protein